jgi:hypothetical protein
MTAISGTVMADAAKHHRTFNTLIRASHTNYIDLETFLPWEAGVDKSKPPKKMDQLWIHATPYEEQLTPEQRLEVAWLETARDLSMFIHLEHFLPYLYGGYLNQYKDELDKKVYEYLMLFAREELTHILAFRRFMQLADLPLFAPPTTWSPFTNALTTLRPEVGVLSTLIIEWMAELAAMHGTQSSEVDPLTRQLFSAHHNEEIRHITFAKAIGSGFFQNATAAEAQEVRQFLGTVIKGLVAAFTYNPEISAFTSFEFPVRPDDQTAIDRVRSSEANRQLNETRFRKLFDWCRKYGIM